MTSTMIAKIEELNELEEMIAELKADAEAIKDYIKEEMGIRGLSQMKVGDYVVRYTDTLTSRLNTKALKEDYLNLYNEYLIQVASKRFTISH